ncbi:MAG: hypothetical protein JWM68_4587 [Verrucomicrobiales bacterium]|nr:hypothetical protein [Verrucomicrobiales bacterium]
MHTLVFELPQVLPIGLVLATGLMTWSVWFQKKRGIPRKQIVSLALFRGFVLVILICMAARPVWVERQSATSAKKTVVLLVDKSESMSLEEDKQTRYQRALAFTREHLLPALQETKLDVQPFLFGEEAEAADGQKLVDAKADSKRTNLGRAISRGLANSSGTPVAVIALTDGAANEKTENMRALSSLLDSHVPFIGVGFGSDIGAQTLSMEQVEAAPLAAPNTDFNVTAHLQTVNVNDLPQFDLVLLRDGEFLQKKTVLSSRGSRFWLESFRVKETKEGAHNYEVRLVPPNIPNLTVLVDSGSTAVRITNERELRVLYVQGALTWDYKFIALALRGDPAIKVTGLTRTSSKSIFRQNVESAGELLNGFPTTLEEIAPFRIVVLSNVRPADLSTPQQELLSKFCGELSGGVLMIGGPETFDASWHESRLEQLLPVVFASSASGVEGLDRPFQLELTDEALIHPVFQVSDTGASQAIWKKLPNFTQYGRVDSAKPGAQVWALHQTDEGPKGRRILMASQRYGAGLTAILTVQNFWRWRLARDCEPQQFDRFWRQLFRFLGDSSRQDIAIHVTDQELRPGNDVRLVLEKQPNPKDITATDVALKFTAHVEDHLKKIVAEKSIELLTSRPVDFSFPAEKAGIYTVSILDSTKQQVATRTIEIRALNVELQNSARNMENLQQWASISDGMALRAEDCRDGNELIAQIKTKIEQAQESRVTRMPAGMNLWTFTLLIGSLCGEWMLRRKWGLA